MHSINIRTHAKRKKEVEASGIVVDSRIARLVDIIVYPVGVTSLVMTFPQIYEVWVVGNVNGVSFISWFAWWLISGFWILYGTIHKVPSMIFMNTGSFVLYGLVALGIYLHT